MTHLARLVACCLLFAPLSSTAQENDVGAVIDSMLQALGGRQAIEALRSLSVEAECTGPGGAFQTAVESFLPGWTFFHQWTDEGHTRVWSAPGRTWRRTSEGAVEDLDQGLRYFVRSHEFHLLLLQIESRFSGHRLGEERTLGGEQCRRIEMEDESGQPAALCVADTGLPLALEMNPAGAAGPIEINFDDWRQIGDLEYFFAFRLTEGPERVFTYAYTRIEPDSVQADLFVDPVASEQQEDQLALLEVLRQDRRAHLETDAALIAESLSDSVVEISSGLATVLSRTDVEEFFQQVFTGARYQMWEDSEPPFVRLSADSTMAWVTRTVRVRRQAPGANGLEQDQQFVSAYTSTYERQDGAWKMTSVTSTFKPAANPGA